MANQSTNKGFLGRILKCKKSYIKNGYIDGYLKAVDVIATNLVKMRDSMNKHKERGGDDE